MNAIVIMAKEPRAHKVKTRLISYLEPATAAALYNGFLLDRIEQVRGIMDVYRYIAYTPDSARDFFEEMAPRDFILIPQQGEDLGERLSNISCALFEKRYEKIVIMDSDSPNLPTSYITSALNNLDDADLVVGPCEDGGYYLVGLSQHAPEIFRDIPWSTSEVTEVTKERAEASGRIISMLEKWYDVDTKEGLLHLQKDLEGLSEKADDMYLCKNTYKIISNLEIE